MTTVLALCKKAAMKVRFDFVAQAQKLAASRQTAGSHAAMKWIGADGSLTPDEKAIPSLLSRIVRGGFVPKYHNQIIRTGGFQILGNRKDNDDNWQTKAPEEIPKVSMSGGPGGGFHRFLVPESLKDGRFALNASTMPATRESLARLQEIREIAQNFVQTVWKIKNPRLHSTTVPFEEADYGLYVHTLEDASMWHLHVHIVHLGEDHVGPAYAAQAHKNILLEVLEQQIRQEIAYGSVSWLHPEHFQGKRVLVLGMGGGCDVISAHALGTHLLFLNPKLDVTWVRQYVSFFLQMYTLVFAKWRRAIALVLMW